MQAWNYISGWTSFSLPKNIQKRLYKFLLRKVIGQFLQTELDLDNFDVGIMNGSVDLRDLDLNLETLNKYLNDTPFILEEGKVESIHVSIPWATFWSGDIYFRIKGLHLALRPIKNKPKASDPFNSASISEEPILSSSLHFADDFLKSEIKGDQVQELHESIQKSFQTDMVDEDMEGLQVLTKVIDKLMARIKIDVLDTLIRIIHTSAVPLVPGDDSSREYHVDICVPGISYYDKTPEFNPGNCATEPPETDTMMESSILLPPAANETIKYIVIASPEIWLKSPCIPSTLSQSAASMYSIPTQSETTINEECEDLSQTEFFDTEDGTSLYLQQQQDEMSGSITPKAFQQKSNSKPYEALLFTTLDQRNYIRLKLRPSLDDTSLLPIKQIDLMITHMRAILSPLQVAFFLDLMDAMSTTDTVTSSPQPTPSAPSTDPILDDLDSFQTNTPYTPYESTPPSSIPDRKIKINLTLIELYLLGNDEPVQDWKQPQHDKSHVRLAIEKTMVKLQQFPHASSVSVNVPNITLSEWIKQPHHVRKNPETKWSTKYQVYNPILEFDSRIKYNYDDEETFPCYDPLIPVKEEGHTDVVRVRIEQKESAEKGRLMENSSFEQDIQVDIQPFKLHIDPRIVDRLDGYILAVMELNHRKEEMNQFAFDPPTPREQRPSVFEDLQSQENTFNRKIRVKLAYIRILLSVPDMSHTSTREEFNDRFHKDQLSVDIKKTIVTWSSMNPPQSMEKETAGFTSREDKQPTKINLEIQYVNVFMHLRKDTLTKTWFTAKTVHDQKYMSGGTLCPTIEIAIQDPNVIYPSTARQSLYFGGGSNIPKTLFDILSGTDQFDAEQKFHYPMEEQSDASMLFRQNTVETSMFAVNCHFPQTRMSLTKPLWDKVQIIQNDLLLWQPMFLIQQQQQEEDLSMSSHHTMSVLSQSHERLPPPSRIHSNIPTPQKTLASIVAVLGSGIWDIRTSDENKYQCNFSEFKYFAAIKHLGQNENMTVLDIEELTLTDISNSSLPNILLYKTIPKGVRPKKDASMLSLVSKLEFYPELNRINKVTSIVTCNICWDVSHGVDVVTHLTDFQKVPEDMVFINPPTQYIKLFSHVLDSSIDYKPKNSPSRAVIVLDGVEIITDILAGQPFIDIKTCIQTAELLLIDDVQEMTSHEVLNGKTSDARKYWTTRGLLNVLALLNVELQVKLKQDEHASGPQTDITLVSTDIHMDSNADSFQSLLNFITYCANKGDTPPSTTPSTRRRSLPHHIMTKDNLLASLDEDAFKPSPTSSISPPTFIEAPDLEDFNYIEEFYKSPTGSPAVPIHNKPPTKPRRKQQRIRTSEDIIRVLVSPEEQESEPFSVVEDYFGLEKKAAESASVVDSNKAVVSLRISHVNFVWKLYDGYAWKYVRSKMASSQQDGFSSEEPDTPPQTALIEIRLDAVSIAFDLMPASDVTALFFHLLIKDVEIIDNIKTSAYKKFLGYMRPPAKEKPRELDACMVDIELVSLRPVKEDPQQEFRIKAKLLPIRLYVDHDANKFLIKFFTFDKSCLISTDAANHTIPQEVLDEEDTDKGDGMFFQYVDILPITLKVDYKPKYIDYGNIKEGQLVELLNLFYLDGAELTLSHVRFTGIKGMDGLAERLSQEWLPHIKNTQVTSMVSGVSPIRSIVNLSTGVADLVLLPIQQYRKDGRIIKGIQRGTSSFARATAIEAIKLSSRVATGTQVILEHADGFFSPPTSSSSNQVLQDHFVYTDIHGVDIPEEDKKRPALTTEISDGFQFAYQNLKGNLGSAAQTIFAVPTDTTEDYSEAGPSHHGHHNSVIRAVPVAVIKPMIGLTGAFQTILAGLRNSIDPVMRLQSEDKYKRRK